MTQKSKIINGTLIYSLSNYIVIGIGFCLGVFTKRILSVGGTGEWYFIFSILPFGLYMDLGILNALSRQIPRDIGAGCPEDAEKKKNVAFTYIIACSVVSAIIFLIISPLFSANALIRSGIAMLGLLVPLTLLYNLNINLFWAHKRISRLSLVIIINSILINVLNIVFALKFGSIGVVFSSLVTLSVMFFISSRMGDFRFKWDFDINECRSLIGIGFPLNVSALMGTIFSNIDKLVIGKFMGFEQLGLYTIAITAITTTSKLPASFSIVLFPYLQEEYGRHKDIRLLKDKLVRSLNCVAMILPVFLVFVFLFMSVIVHYFLPKFLNGILPMMVLIFGFYFMLLKDVPHTILYTINKQKYIAATLGALLLLYVPSIYMLSTHGFGIVSIAFATALVYLSYFTVLFLIGFRHISGAREQFTILLSIAAVYSYAVGSYMLIDRFILLGNALACAAVKMAVFTVVYLPLLLYIEKKEGLIRYMVSLVLRKRDSINA